MRVGKVLRVHCGLTLQRRFDTVGQVMRGECLERDGPDGLSLLRITLDTELALNELQVPGGAFELVRRNDARLLDQVVRSLLDGLTTDRERTRAVCVHAVRSATGITVHHLDVIDTDAKDAGRNLAPSRLMALPVWRCAGDEFHLAGWKHPDRCVLPATGHVLECAQSTRRCQAAHLGEGRDANA